MDNIVYGTFKNSLKKEDVVTQAYVIKDNAYHRDMPYMTSNSTPKEEIDLTTGNLDSLLDYYEEELERSCLDLELCKLDLECKARQVEKIKEHIKNSP